MKIPSNIHFEILDLSFPGTNRYRPIEDKITMQEADENRQLVRAHTGAKEFFSLEQIHGTELHYADFERPIGEELAGDASYTDKKGILLHIGTADCVPVIFYADDGSVVGAAHAGWSGAKNNIMKLLYQELARKSDSVSAIIGPCISQESYEVGPEFYANFIDQTQQNQRFFIDSDKQNHKMFDIRGYVRDKLSELKLTNIYEIEEDTYSHKLQNGEYKYPSYRRFCHGSDELYPRVLASTIMIKD